MDFYQTLSKYYDELFPAHEDESAFVDFLLSESNELLDIGCGTGNKTVLLARKRRAVGFDVEESMIARANAAYAGPNLHFFTLDMRDISSVLTPGSFDSAVCLGNTLPHMHRREDLLQLFQNLHAILRPNSLFVGQILNYDRIIKKGIAVLPVLDTPNVRFERTYRWHEGQMLFVTRVTDKNSGDMHDNTIPLRPILRSGLDSILSISGFGLMEHYGSYAGETFDDDESYHLFVRATRL